VLDLAWISPRHLVGKGQVQISAPCELPTLASRRRLGRPRSAILKDIALVFLICPIIKGFMARYVRWCHEPKQYLSKSPGYSSEHAFAAILNVAFDIFYLPFQRPDLHILDNVDDLLAAFRQSVLALHRKRFSVHLVLNESFFFQLLESR
jgi:hypothetical protein